MHHSLFKLFSKSSKIEAHHSLTHNDAPNIKRQTGNSDSIATFLFAIVFPEKIESQKVIKPSRKNNAILKLFIILK